MPRRPPLAAGLLALLLLGGCASSPGDADNAVPVAAVNGLSPNVLLSCTAFKGLLPKTMPTDIPLRPATPLSATTAAYGDPAISLRCGIPAGSPRDEQFTANDVVWAMHDSGASRTWTTKTGKVNVAVEIPDHYENMAELIGVLAPAFMSALK